MGIMKKVSIAKNITTLTEAIKIGSVHPNVNERMDIKIVDECMVISTKESFEDIEEAYLVAYDKKESSVVAYQPIEVKQNNCFTTVITNGFLNAINRISEFKYARLCIAVKTIKECYFFYLTCSNDTSFDDSNCYVGHVGRFKNLGEDMYLMVYYSQMGLLSVKYISQKEYFNSFCNCTLEKLEHNENQVIFTLSCACNSDVVGEPVLISRTTNKIAKRLAINIINRINTSSGREILECKIDYSGVYTNDFDGYYLAYQFGKELIDISISDNSDIAFEELFNEIYNVGSEENSFNVAYSIMGENQIAINVAKCIYPYMFSIIMAVYNTEQFLEEALESILRQNTEKIKKYVVGNEIEDYSKQIYRNIYEVITVDDGATDSSGAICDRYAEENRHFKVIHKENGGVSTARNAGIEVAQGKYLNFMDSDDRFSEDVLTECFLFFEDNYDKTDMITFPIRFFDASTGDHWLNGKFSNGNRVINMFDEYDKAIMFVNASVFKAEKIKGKINFDSSLTTGEDIRFIYSLFFKEGARFGVVKSCTYWYRRRSVGEPSAIQASKTSRNYYFEYLSECLNWLLVTSKDVYGTIPQYVQYIVAQQLQWRFKEDEDGAIAKTIISDVEFEEYKEYIRKLLQYIDGDIILEQKKIFREQKKFILEFKTGKTLEKYYDGVDVNYFYEGKRFTTASSNYIRIEFLKLNKEELYIEGFNMSFEKDSEVYIKVDEEYIKLEKESRDMSVYSLGEPIFISSAFKYVLKLNDVVDNYRLEFYEKINGNFIQKQDIRYAKTVPLSTQYKKSYYTENNWGIRKEENTFVLSNLFNIENASKYFNEYEKEFIEQISKSAITQVEKEAVEFRKELVPFISNYKRYKRKKIWLISDRVNLAGDNGEAFYLYMLQRNEPDIEMYFVINEDSIDYDRMKQLGNVVVQNSKKHLLLHFIADYVISSQANEYVINPFFHDGTTDMFRDLLYKPKFVFLQHGVIKDDLSDWLNRYKKDMTGFVTAAVPEYKSILEYDYYYTDKEVWLTGLPRHDRLYNDEKKYITIMPTWRKYLSTSHPDNPEVTLVKDGFEESEFFKFYNNLINNEKLIEVAKKAGYTICFMPHPNIMNNLDVFEHNPFVKFFGTEKPYREIYAQSNRVITDYSSSVMDFAYLRKPIVYCQFDKEEFFSGDHVYVKGYFEYERDGFGEVTYDLDTLVDTIIDYINNDCKLKNIYKERMDKFFAYKDKKNCERLFNRLMEED